ncbi:hypothetical protein MGYG_04064 [Nannizzia gypsea CBS 118893]|uniref:Uncharacterized protein n=1 Tax=Arthroderma gypseum (strain ATCC MYA-4604 / CBS 118893) TaxID=535722 RepID=E4UUU4_ARTGP|nr:hypothetical protein MGYG_04064 [Nannizzia gypsea CBS 118893]EFR01061.1 hypothetical protein MGYG_04064 [Nannizzia gypsea CBS 118893]
MSGTKILSRSALHDKMKAASRTCRWDVLVSYSAEELNKVLRKQWEGSKLFTHATFETVTMGGNLISKFDLTLGFPQLQIKSLSALASASLSIPIEGTMEQRYKQFPPEIFTITPNNFSLEVGVPLAVVDGEETGGSIQTSEQSIIFEDTRTSDRYITLNFKNSGTSWTVHAKKTDVPDKDSVFGIVNDVRTWFENRQNLVGIKLRLARISNHEDKTSDILRPKSFRFAGPAGVLLIFIQTKGSGFEQGDNMPTFDTDSTSPIPNGSTASIILSRDLFQDKFLLPGIRAKFRGASEIKTDTGISLKVRQENQVIISGRYEIRYGVGTTIIKVDTLTVDFDKNPLDLSITDQSPYTTPVYKWNWDFEGTTEYTQSRDWFKHKLKINAKLSSPARDLAEYGSHTMRLRLELLQSDNVEVSNDQFEFLELKVKLTSFNLDLDELNFFATTNILVPDTEFVNFHASMVPFDYIIMGDIKVPT